MVLARSCVFIYSCLAVTAQPSCRADVIGGTACHDSTVMLQAHTRVAGAGKDAHGLKPSPPVEANDLPIYYPICPSSPNSWCHGPTIPEVLPFSVFKVLDTPSQVASVTLMSDSHIKRPKDLEISVRPLGENWKHMGNARFPGIDDNHQIIYTVCGSDGTEQCNGQNGPSKFTIPISCEDTVTAVQVKIISEWGTSAGNGAIMISGLDVQLKAPPPTLTCGDAVCNEVTMTGANTEAACLAVVDAHSNRCCNWNPSEGGCMGCGSEPCHPGGGTLTCGDAVCNEVTMTGANTEAACLAVVDAHSNGCCNWNPSEGGCMGCGSEPCHPGGGLH